MIFFLADPHFDHQGIIRKRDCNGRGIRYWVVEVRDIETGFITSEKIILNFSQHCNPRYFLFFFLVLDNFSLSVVLCVDI
jgi:hypothetical protein